MGEAARRKKLGIARPPGRDESWRVRGSLTTRVLVAGQTLMYTRAPGDERLTRRQISRREREERKLERRRYRREHAGT